MHFITPPRDRGRRGVRSVEEEFVLYLQGIPPHCRWQELKDLVRQTALHIRQAVVYDDQNGPTGLGQIIVKNEDEAFRTYRKLSTTGWDSRHPLVVTLARASSPTKPIAGPTRSWLPSAHVVPYVSKYARYPFVGTPTPELPFDTETFQSRSTTASGSAHSTQNTSPPYTPAIQAIQSCGYHADSPSHFGYQQSPSTWSMQQSSVSSPTVTMFPPPPIQQARHPYHFQQQPAAPLFDGDFRYFDDFQHQDHHQHQQFMHATCCNQYLQSTHTSFHPCPNTGFYTHGHGSRKPNFPSFNVYTAPAMSPYNTEGQINSHQAFFQTLPTNPETCHIIIDNVRPTVQQQTIRDHFQKVGCMIDCQIHRYENLSSNSNEQGEGGRARYNESNYPGQCYVTATFATAEEAKKSIKEFNGTKLDGTIIVVRLDTDWNNSIEHSVPVSVSSYTNAAVTVTTTPTPTVANVDGLENEYSNWSPFHSPPQSLATGSNGYAYTPYGYTPAASPSTATPSSPLIGAFPVYSDSHGNFSNGTINHGRLRQYHCQHYPQHHHHHNECRNRRDSGKEVFKCTSHSFLDSSPSTRSDCTDDKSSWSVSPTTLGPEKEDGPAKEQAQNSRRFMQPLVVNGSGVGDRSK